MYFAIRSYDSFINTVFNGFIPKNFTDVNLLQHCYYAINMGDSEGFRRVKLSGIRPLSTMFLFSTDHT